MAQFITRLLMMPSPSRVQLNSDAEPTGLLNSDVIAHHSSASDHSDLIPDPVELERELAQEGLHEELDANEQANDGSMGATISYEKALARELEYRKRMKMTLSQHPFRSTLLPTPSQPATTGIRNPTLLPPQQPLLFRQPSLLPSLLQFPNLPPQQPPQFRQPSLPQLQVRPLQQPLQFRQPSLQPLQVLPQPQPRKPPPLGPNGRQPLPRPQQWHNQQPPNYQENPLWCHLCKVKCVTLQNLKSHRLGKKHKTRWDAVFGNKTTSTSSAT